jgi:hydrogenase maturation protease
MTIRVLGLGNVLMSDDGFGPYVIRVLDAEYEFPENVEIVDVGTPGLDLTPFLLDADAVVFIDTVKSAGAPGDIRTYDRDQILRHPPQIRVSPHDPGVKEGLLTVAAAGAGPTSVTLIGVVPDWVATGVTLSPAVRAAIEPVIAHVAAALERLGAPIRRRQDPRPAEIWWQASESPLAERSPGVHR